MTLLLSAAQLSERARIANGPLSPLRASLAADLEPLLTRDIHFPAEKALLSREGGRCARDGTYLEFDPFNRHEHRCPRCGEVYRGPLHDRFWIYWYQLWLVERAVHASALAALGDDRFEELASRILIGYAERYASYPNVDNVLGPTRLFFSTYLESIWLLNICIAADLLEPCNPSLVDQVRDRIIAPSREIIVEYDEGASNRQVWNDAALLAAARMLGDATASERAIFGGSGIAFHLSNGLLADGTWYEGENYHLFAHRGLWYGVTLAERAGMQIDAPLIERFERGFAAPFATALPDLTLPSRRDSQYAISLRQWRIAEHCELGFARSGDRELLGALQRLYDDAAPPRPTGRDRSSADVERNAPESRLTRADLSWRALLFALAELPQSDPIAPESALLQAQGIAVFRRDEGQAYVALDYGHSGGGHGHPDRLNLTLAVGSTRWLDDFGTGSYVDPSLHWYRSSLAHNAPLVNGKSQLRVHGDLAAYAERGDIGWIAAAADGIAPGAAAARTLVVMPSYVVDSLVWEAAETVTIDLPIHMPLSISRGASEPAAAPLVGSEGLEDGFRFVRASAVQHATAGDMVVAQADVGSSRLDVFALSDTPAEWWRATAPGAPGSGDHTFRIIRATGAQGEHRIVWSWRGDVSDVEFGESIRVTLADGSVHVHEATESGWAVIAGRQRFELGGLIEIGPSAAASTTQSPVREPITVGRDETAFIVESAHYRRSEQSWENASRPTARIALKRDAGLTVTIDVPRSDLTFVAAGAENSYDNEPADINGDSIQLYTRGATGLAAWMLVPELESDRVRIRPIAGWDSPAGITATWARSGEGYRVIARLATPPDAIDVIINEMPSGRLRRRGQLILSGAASEFVYLQGDRHPHARLIPIRYTE